MDEDKPQRTAERMHRIFGPGVALATGVLFWFHFGFLKILGILISSSIVYELLVIWFAPGPRAKDFVDRLKNQIRRG